MAAEPRGEAGAYVQAVEARAKLDLVGESIVPHFADPDGTSLFLYEPDHRSLFRYFEHYAATVFKAHIGRKFPTGSGQQRAQLRDKFIGSLIGQILPDKPLSLEHRRTVVQNVNAGPIDSIRRDGLAYRIVEPSGDWEDILQQCWSQIRKSLGDGREYFGVLWDGGYRSKLRDPDEAEYFRDRIRNHLFLVAEKWEAQFPKATNVSESEQVVKGHPPREVQTPRQRVIDAALARKEWSKGDWAERAGVDRSTVYRFYNGKTNLQQATRAKMLNVLGLSEEEKAKL